MAHQPFIEDMHALLDGHLPGPARQSLEQHLGACGQCQAAWASLRAAHHYLRAAPLAAPRPGFAHRFSGRLAERRSRPRLFWGGLALGAAAVTAAAVVVPLGASLGLGLVNVLQQPATAAALASSARAVGDLLSTLGLGLLLTLRALLAGAVQSPAVWAVGIAALGLTGAWLYFVRKLIPETLVQ
jgi:anti-sigma factor RsiW